MDIIKITDPTAAERLLAVWRAGGLALCPTETVYGCFADATNSTAIDKLLSYKRRPAGKAISIAVADQTQAEKYVQLNDQARRLYQQFLPGPVTVISASRHRTDPRLESEFGTLGVRIPQYDWLLEAMRSFGSPVTATSANSAGQKNPYQLSDAFDRLSTKQKNLLDIAIDAGTLPKNPPSLVIDTTASTPIVMRQNSQFDQFSSPTQTVYSTASETETCRLAGQLILPRLATLFQTGLIIALDGELGAGKTTLTRALGEFLGVDQIINSPTYTYLKEYSYNKFDHSGPLYHADVWSIDSPAMLAALDLDSLQGPGKLLIIEWYE